MISERPNQLETKCQAFCRQGRGGRCKNRAVNGSAPFCGQHTNWAFYYDPDLYPRVCITGRRFSGSQLEYCYYGTWTPVHKLVRTEEVKEVNAWDQRNDVIFVVSKARKLADGRFRVRWKYYPATYDTVEPLESFNH